MNSEDRVLNLMNGCRKQTSVKSNQISYFISKRFPIQVLRITSTIEQLERKKEKKCLLSFHILQHVQLVLIISFMVVFLSFDKIISTKPFLNILRKSQFSVIINIILFSKMINYKWLCQSHKLTSQRYKLSGNIYQH